MQKKTEKQNYRSILRDCFETRAKKNPQYSQRAFARDIGISANRLSEVLNNKQGVSRDVAVRMSSKLGFSPDDTDYFCDLVDVEHARNKTQRDAAKLRIRQQLDYKKKHNSLELDQFRIISEWFHLAILELANLKGFKSEIPWIAKKLGLSSPETSTAVDRLIRVGLLAKNPNGFISPVHQVNETTRTQTPSEIIQRFHRRMIEKAIVAIENQPIEQRDFSTLMLSIKRTDLRKAKERIREFCMQFCEEFNCTNQADEVYSLTAQFFSLSRELTEN